MKISYVSPADQTLASFRYRVLIPASQLKSHEVYVDAEPEADADIAIFSKHWATNIIQAKAFKGVTVYDICDDHFADDHRLDYKAMCRICDFITCNSESMRDRIKEVTGRDAAVIPDPYEMPLAEAVFKPNDVPNLVWFGHSTNLHVLQHTPLVGNLEIVTSCEAKQSGPVTWTPYSGKAVIEAMHRADIVVIPQDKPCKSANRLIESLRQGKFVVASSIPSYEEFKDYAWLCNEPEDFTKGILWALDNQEAALKMIQQGQGYIEKFSPKAIGTQWESLFESILVQDAIRSMAG